MSFSINTLQAIFPIGSICAYAGGATDPPGWVIGDGVQRTNTNGIYTNLANLGIGTLSDANYTPPDLTSCTMIGKTPTTTLRDFVGRTNNSVPLSTSNMPSHTHGSSISAHDNTHTHLYNDMKMDDSVNSGKRPTNNGSLTDTDVTRTTSSANSHGHEATSSNNTGSATPINILNSSYIVNWIAKL